MSTVVLLQTSLVIFWILFYSSHKQSVLGDMVKLLVLSEMKAQGVGCSLYQLCSSRALHLDCFLSDQAIISVYAASEQA